MKWIAKCILGILAFCALALGIGWITMWLWNWLMPDIFGLQMITYWQAFGLLILGKLLFGRIGGGRGGCHHCGHGGWKHHHRGGYWRKRWESKMAKMSPEEREKFRMGMNKCGWYGEEYKPGTEGDSTQQ